MPHLAVDRHPGMRNRAIKKAFAIAQQLGIIPIMRLWEFFQQALARNRRRPPQRAITSSTYLRSSSERGLVPIFMGLFIGTEGLRGGHGAMASDIFRCEIA